MYVPTQNNVLSNMSELFFLPVSTVYSIYQCLKYRLVLETRVTDMMNPLLIA